MCTVRLRSLAQNAPQQTTGRDYRLLNLGTGSSPSENDAYVLYYSTLRSPFIASGALRAASAPQRLSPPNRACYPRTFHDTPALPRQPTGAMHLGCRLVAVSVLSKPFCTSVSALTSLTAAACTPPVILPATARRLLYNVRKRRFDASDGGDPPLPLPEISPPPPRTCELRRALANAIVVLVCHAHAQGARPPLIYILVSPIERRLSAVPQNLGRSAAQGNPTS